MILYEIADIAYNVTKLTYNGARAAYCWYYDIKDPEQQTLEEQRNIIIELQNRVRILEEQKADHREAAEKQTP